MVVANSQYPDFISCFSEKIRLFSSDIFFLQGWGVLTHCHARGSFSFNRLWTLGSVMLKADAIICNNGLVALDFLEANGFKVRAVRAVNFSNAVVSHLWHYSLGRFSVQRIELLMRLQSIAPSLYLIVEYVGENDDRIPCSLRLTELKGQASPYLRKPTSLRYAMGLPQSTFFSFVHTADEPADFVRELGLLFRADEIKALIAETNAESEVDSEAAYAKLAARSPHSDLDFTLAWGRLKEQVASSCTLPQQQSDLLCEAFGSLVVGDYSAWVRLKRELIEGGVAMDPIDEITIESQLIPLKQENVVQPFPSCEAHHWHGHFGAAASFARR